jgi:hypothetical protein
MGLVCLCIFYRVKSRDLSGEEKVNNFAEQEAWEKHQIGIESFLFHSFRSSLVFLTVNCMWLRFLLIEVFSHLTHFCFSGKSVLKFGAADKRKDDSYE